MSFQTWNETVKTAIADATAVANTTTETSIYSWTTPADYMSQGRALRIRAFGKLSTTGTPTIIFGLRWGGAAGVLLAATETLTNGSGVTNVNWSIEGFIVSRSIGASGTFLAFGDAQLHTSSSAVLSTTFGISGFDAPAVATVDTTIDKVLALTATWSAASASNTLTGMWATLESMN
jgi:hypothetical protein